MVFLETFSINYSQSKILNPQMPHSLIAFQNFPFFSQSKIEKNSFQHKTPSVPQIKQKYSTDFWFFLAENTNIIIYAFLTFIKKQTFLSFFFLLSFSSSLFWFFYFCSVLVRTFPFLHRKASLSFKNSFREVSAFPEVFVPDCRHTFFQNQIWSVHLLFTLCTVCYM